MNNPTKISICPITDGSCDKTCGFQAHGLITKAIPVAHQHIIVRCKICYKVIAQCGCIADSSNILCDLRTCNDCITKRLTEDFKPID